MTLGQRIQELRKQAGLSQEGLGEALGVSRQAVSKWESDGGIPELDTLIAMSRLFFIPVGQLLGVETPEEREEPQPAAPGFTEEQVEDILRRYVKESRPPRETPASWLAKWGWLPAAAIVALTVIAVLFARVNSLKSTVRMMQSDISTLSNHIGNLSGTIRNSIYDILAEEEKLLNTFDWTLEDFDLEAQTVTLSLEATLKEYKAGSTMQFILDCTDADQKVERVVSDFVAGPNFSAAVILPMNYHTEVSIRLQDEEGNIQEQFVDAIYTLHGENMRLDSYNLRSVLAMTIRGKGIFTQTARAERPRVEIFSSFPEKVWPVKAVYTVRLNGEQVLCEGMDLERSGDGTEVWEAGLKDGYFEVNLTEGDSLEISLVVVDSLGREEEFLDSGTVNDGQLKSPPMAAPVVPVG